jgi:hypothetical protein
MQMATLYFPKYRDKRGRQNHASLQFDESSMTTFCLSPNYIKIVIMNGNSLPTAMPAATWISKGR